MYVSFYIVEMLVLLHFVFNPGCVAHMPGLTWY